MQGFRMTRRQVMLASATASAFAVARPAHALLAADAPQPPQQPMSAVQQLSPAASALLEDIVHRGCMFFWEQADPKTGQVRDRAALSGKNMSNVSSIAATGFGLTALCIASRYKYLPQAQIEQRVLNTLTFLAEKVENVYGFFYHFLDMQSGARAFNCELSSIDTALLLCGVLTCRKHLNSAKIEALATKIYERVEWNWMLNGGKAMSMGWFPDRGFLDARWEMFAEQMGMNLMAIGSPTHPIPPQVWQDVYRAKVEFGGLEYLSCDAPIFIHQYAHAYVDFRNQRDRYANYFTNATIATRAHQLFCLTLGSKYPWINQDMWGISASDGEKGYSVWGGPPATRNIDGTLVPNAAAGSLVFLPAECSHVLLTMKDRFNGKAWTRYGFVDAFHAGDQWFAPDILGIDQGISVLMAENLRSEFVWQTFMKNPEIPQAMQMVGFHPDTVCYSGG